MNDHLYAVIMAGGVGTRLWPRSRTATPKQFLDLLGRRTMLQETVARIAPLVPPSQIIVVASREYGEMVREQIAGLLPENTLLEPCARNTAPCIGLAAVALRRRDPEAIMAVFPADHCIADGEGLRRAICAATRLAAEGYLTTLGVEPKVPHTGYGYIQRGAPLGESGGFRAFRVQRFTEKPDAVTAQQLVQSGDYYWNAGIFIWRADRILEEIAIHLPSLAVELESVAGAWGSVQFGEVLAAAWERVPRMSIDLGVMEKAARAAVVPVDLGWDDVGDWAALAALAVGDAEGNVVHGEGRHLLLDASGTYVYGGAGRLVALVGVHDLIVVDTPDALLVCPKDRSQSVREVVEQLKAEGLDGYV